MPPVTRAQVFTAADKISAAGQQPTVASVRATIGSGSFTTITALLREWKEQANPTTPSEVDVPEEVTAAMARAAQLVWTAATDKFSLELATLQKESARAIQEANTALTDALAEIEKLEEMNFNSSEANIKLGNEMHDLHQQIIALDRTQATLWAKLKAADARIAEQSRLLDRLTQQTDPRSSAPTTTASPPTRKKPSNPTASSLVPKESPAPLEKSTTTPQK